MGLIKCPDCGKEISDKSLYCLNCGCPVRQEEVPKKSQSSCPNCGNPMEPGSSVCSECGAKLISVNGAPVNGTPTRVGKISIAPVKRENKANNSKKTGGALAIAAMVCGIIGLCLSFVLIGILPAIAGLIMAIVAFCMETPKKKMAWAGVITSILGVLIAVVIYGNDTNSSSKRETEKVKTPTTEEQEKAIQENEGEQIERESEEQQEVKEELTIEEQIIYEGHDTIIKVIGCEEVRGDLAINIYIENNSSLNLGFNAHSYAVNEIMTRDGIYAMDCDVAAGKKANTSIVIEKSFLEEFGIIDIKTIDVLFWAYDNDKMFKEFETNQIRISTNKEDGVVESVIGKRLYNDNNITIDYMGNTGDSYVYCLTNNTGNYFDFDVSNISINDYTVSEVDYDLYNEQILDRARLLFIINVEDEFKEQNGINIIEKIDFSLEIRPLGDYFNDWSTGEITQQID